MTDDERDEASTSDEDTRYLDDDADRPELRQRYYGLLQELRVVLPGVQVLLAFLLTVPFAQRFNELDAAGRRAFQVALTGSMLSVIFLLGPTFLHRFGERRARRDRLLWSIRLMVVGLAPARRRPAWRRCGAWPASCSATARRMELVIPVGVAMVGGVDRRAAHAAASGLDRCPAGPTAGDDGAVTRSAPEQARGRNVPG